MRTRPLELRDGTLAAALEAGWGLGASTMAYLPVGAGSHHWRVDDVDATWFVTVDDLDARRHDPTESRAQVFERLAAAITTAHVLSRGGADFVVAPEPACSGAVIERFGERWTAAVYPMIAGDTLPVGECQPTAVRLEVVTMIARLHAMAAPRDAPAHRDDYRLQSRANIETALVGPRSTSGAPSYGPYGSRIARLLERHGPLILDMLGQHDGLVASARARSPAEVITHGEPHAGNTMRTVKGWRLIDWDTTLLAPPERDMWMLETGDGEAAAAYTAATGIELRPELLTLFQLRWDLSDLGVDLAQLEGSRDETADDERAFGGIEQILDRRSAGNLVPDAAWR